MAISNFDIKELALLLKLGNVQVFMQDELKNNKIDTINGKYVINFGKYNNPNTRGGTHWVGLQTRNGECVYYDSYGMVMPIDIEEFAKSDKSIKHIGYNSKIIQPLESQLCGWYSLGFLTFNSRSNRSSVLESANDYSNIYSDQVDFNDGRLRGLFLEWIKQFPKRLYQLLMEKIIYT